MENRGPGKILLTVIFALITFGLVMIASAGIIYSQTRFGDQYFFFRRQLLFGVFPGLVAFYFFQRINYRFWKKMAFPLFLVTLILLSLVFVPSVGIKTYGASRWIQLGSLSFQPSEMLKFTVIIYLSLLLANKGRKGTKDFFEGLLPFMAILGMIGFLLVKQPDVGTLGIVSVISLAIYFSAGAKISHILSLILAGILGLGILVKLEPYRFNRILTFLNPEADPQGVGYHINQALIAIGSGGFFGIGLGHSRQKFNYLPEPVGDSIFAIIGEELGLMGALVLIALFILIAVKGFQIAKRAPDDFGKLVATGITTWIVFQAFINISAITSLIPLTGVPLPFISYGGTSLVFLLASSGLLLNVAKQIK